jgi:hypothetical protein
MAGDLIAQPDQDQADPLIALLSAAQQSQPDQGTKIPMRPKEDAAPASQPQKLIQPPPDASQLPVDSRQPLVSPVEPKVAKQIPNVPMQRADSKSLIPGTQHYDDQSGTYKATPLTYGERMNPYVGMFAEAGNIHNPFLRVLAKIGSAVPAIAEGTAQAKYPELADEQRKLVAGPQDERAKEAGIQHEQASTEDIKAQQAEREKALNTPKPAEYDIKTGDDGIDYYVPKTPGGVPIPVQSPEGQKVAAGGGTPPAGFSEQKKDTKQTKQELLDDYAGLRNKQASGAALSTDEQQKLAKYSTEFSVGDKGAVQTNQAITDALKGTSVPVRDFQVSGSDTKEEAEKKLSDARAEAQSRRAQGTADRAADKQDNESKAIEATAQALAHGDLTPLKDVASLRGDQRLLIFNRAKQLNPEFNTAQVNRQIKMLDDFTNGEDGKNLRSFGTFLEHAGVANKVIQSFRGGSIAPAFFNKPLNYVESHGYGTQIGQLRTALEPVGKEFENFLLGGKNMYADDRKAVDTILSDSSTPAQMQAALKQMVHTVSARYNESQNSFQNTMTGTDVNGQKVKHGFSYFGIEMTPEAMQAADTLGRPDGATHTGVSSVDGKTYYLDANGKKLGKVLD